MATDIPEESIKIYPVINHNKNLIQRYLDTGDRFLISKLFLWIESPFPEKEWVSVRDSGAMISEEQLSYLRWLLKSNPSDMKPQSSMGTDFRTLK